jgi:hypothetical protein
MEDKVTLLSVNLQHQEYPGGVPIRYITYKSNFVQITQSQYEEVMSELPQKWSNENDRISRFNVSVGPSEKLIYYVGMEKRIFDFRIKDYVKKNYVKEVSEEDADQLYNFFKQKHTTYALGNIDNFYGQILDTVEQVPITSLKIKKMRDVLLVNSDVYMVSDYPISDEDREKWKIYRQELRDLTTQEAWPDDLANIKIPVAPIPKTQFELIKNMLATNVETYKNYGADLFESAYEDLIRNFVSVSTKIEIINSISRMNIPIFNEGHMGTKDAAMELNAIAKQISFVPEENISVIDQVNSKISEINEKIKTYNLGFTIQDIIDDVLRNRSLTEQAEQLIEEL